MKIVHFSLGRVNPQSSNGVDKAIYYLSKHQALLGHNVYLHCLTSKKLIPIDRVNVKYFSSKRYNFYNLNNIIKEIELISPDIVHLHSVFFIQNILLAKSLRKKNISYVVSPHGGLTKYRLKRRKWAKLAYKYLLESSYWNNASFIHAVGESEEEFLREYGIKQPIVISPHAIDLTEIPDPKLINNNYLREKYPKLINKKILLFLGRLDAFQKGLDIMLHAYARVKDYLKDYYLVFAGPDWHNQKKKLTKILREFSIEDRVIFTGPVYGEEKYDVLASSDIFIHPSRSEAAIPFSVLEALAIGKPCVISEHVSYRNFFKEYDCAFQLKLSIENLSMALKRISTINKDKLIKMGMNAKRGVSKEFSWINSAKILCDSYDNHCI